MKKIFNKELLKKILVFFILLQPLLDTYILFDEITMDIFKISPSTVIRLLFILLMGIISLFVIKSKKQWLFYGIYAVLGIIYSGLHIYNALNFTSLFPDNFNFSIKTEVFYIIRMIIPLFLIIITSNIKFTKKEFLKIINILVLLISGTIVVTNILKISIGAYVTKPIEYNIFDWFIKRAEEFTVYEISTRAYFSFANMISCVLFGFNAILYYQFFKKQNFVTIFLIIIQLLATFMLGTKVATYGFILSTVVMLIVYLFFCFIKKELKFKFKLIGVIGLIIISWLLIYPYSPCNTRVTDKAESVEKKDEEEKKNNNKNTLKQTDKKIDKLEGEERQKYLVKYVYKNYKKYSIKKDYIINKYSYKYDPEFWYGMFSESNNKKSDNRFLTTSILNRIKEINNNEVMDYLFGVTYSRMTNISILERDFLSQYYTLGILGFILFVSPYILIVVMGAILIVINYKKRCMTLENVSILVCLGAAFLGAFYCGNSLDNLTLSIIYAFICGYFIRNLFTKKETELEEDEVTIFALHLGYGGVEQYISSLCKMLKDNYKINLISTYKVSDKPAFEFDKNINITYLINDKPNKEDLKKALRNKKIVDIFKESFKNLKIIILKYYRNIIAIINTNSKYIITTRYFHNKLVQKYANNGIITIATEHNFHNNDKKYIRKVVNSVKDFNYLVPVSENLKKFYEKKLKHTKCLFIPNVVENNSSEVSKLKNNVLINVGRFEAEKAQLELIEIIKEVKKDIPNIKLYLIGDGSLRNCLESKVKEYDLEKNIVFTGFINKNELSKYYLNSSLFVMTSFTESFGLVLLEAQNYGVPCIAYDSADGAKELLKDNIGVLVKNRDRKKMIKEILHLLSNKSRLKEIAKKGKENCCKYHIDNVKNKWLELLGGKYEKTI